jgi:hypothetical protein
MMLLQRTLFTLGFIVAFPVIAVFVAVAMFLGGLRAIWCDKG